MADDSGASPIKKISAKNNRRRFVGSRAAASKNSASLSGTCCDIAIVSKKFNFKS